MEHKKYWLGLKLICGYSNGLFRLICEYFGSPEEVWKADLEKFKTDFAKIKGFSADLVEKLIIKKKDINLEEEFEKVLKLGIELITVEDSSYPPLLLEIFNRPPLLFIKGDLIKKQNFSVAIVGSRRASSYGKLIAEELARGLSQKGITVISGLARGIDSAAHKGALENKGGTVAVTGCGLDIIYPPENKKLFSEICEKGSVVSEFPLGTTPVSYNFPLRNRIISGLTRGVVIVEASEKSGALITADFALEQGREVFAVPGAIRSSQSKGTNKLIKTGACLVENANDILEEFGFTIEKSDEKHREENDFSKEEQTILEILENEPKQIDVIVGETQFSASKVASMLTLLEIKGFLKQDAGKNYIRMKY
ncbi:MAG: DNA-protecting protein DprA [Actinobacteria bacterium]|nr:DNA-protecting protein DprA [Actinomycetota bacterium]